MQPAETKKNWTITPDAFGRLLGWLDEGTDSEGQNYLEMRRRLLVYFDRKNCLSPDELADETLNRVARRLEEVGTIESEPPAKFCYITARFVFLEYLRRGEKTHVPLDEKLVNEKNLQSENSDKQREEREHKEKMLQCLEHCTGKMEPINRELITSYYYGNERAQIENRRLLAEKLAISSNALAIRACRMRDKLEICVEKCVANR